MIGNCQPVPTNIWEPSDPGDSRKRSVVYFHTYIIYHCPVQVVPKSSKINFFRLKIVEIPTFMKLPEKNFKKSIDRASDRMYIVIVNRATDTDTPQTEER